MIDAGRLYKHISREECLSPVEEADLLMEILSDNNDGDTYRLERKEMEAILDSIDALASKIYRAIGGADGYVNETDEVAKKRLIKSRRNAGLNTLVAVTNLVFKHYDICHSEGGYSTEGIEEYFLDELKKYWKLNRNDIKTQYASELRLIHLKTD